MSWCLVPRQLAPAAQVPEDVRDSSSKSNREMDTDNEEGRQTDTDGQTDTDRAPCHQACVSCCLFQRVSVKVLTSGCGYVPPDQTCDLEMPTDAVETHPYDNTLEPHR